MPEGSHPDLHQRPMGEESPQPSSSLSTSPPHGDVDLSPRCYRQRVEPVDAERQRPLSLVSTLSSGSSRDSHSLFESGAGPPGPSEDDIDLELSPPGTGDQNPPGAGDQNPPGAGDQNPPARRGRWQERLQLRVSDSAASPVAADAMAPNPRLSHVDRVVMEIMETERMYVRDLRSIVEDYLVHIIDMSSLPIQPEQVCALFGNIEDIYVFNSELLQTLDMCDSDPVAIAQCFVDKSEYFDIYTQYCTNYPNSVAALTDCMRDKTLAKFFRERQAALKRSLPLGSYLLKPVQRILKYHLLLQEIAKHFDPEEEGYEVVQEAIATMTGVAWYINDMKRKHEHAVRVQEIQSLLINWKGSDLTTYGELVLEGSFHVLRAKNTRTLFLFEKMLLITKKRGENYVYKIHISCSTLMLLDSAKDPLLFSVIHFKRPKQPHTVQAKSMEEKRLWAHHIKRLILENHNAIVPQKVKDLAPADPNNSGKYHYSPERLQKTESCQGADFHRGARNERRRSEPAKQIVGNAAAVLKHADSDGALLGDRCRLQPSASALDPPPAEAPGVDASLELLGPGDGEGGLQEEQGGGLMDEQEDVNGDRAEVKATPTDTRRQDEECEDVEAPPATQETWPLDCGLQAKTSDQLVELHPDSPDQQQEVPELHGVSLEPGEEEELGSDSSGLQVEERSVLTNGELSEEEDMHRASILPSSVLHRASAIAERCISGLLSEERPAPSGPPPPADSVSSVEPQTSASSAPEPFTTLLDICASLGHESLTEREPRSTLSRRDRLLICKIRTYYEHAEHQDASFSIKRRESLSYIPAGLVRQLSTQLNSGPQAQPGSGRRKSPSRNRPTSWSVFDLPGLEKTTNTESDQKSGAQIPAEARARSQSVAHGSSTGDVFRSSSEMLEVWQDMEPEEEQQTCNDSARDAMQDINASHGETTGPLSSDSEGTETRSPTTSPAVEGPDQESNKSPLSHSQLPKIISFRSSVDEDHILQDMGKVKNKVFQLARQYSQRIKNNRPAAWQRREGAGQGFRSMPAVHEEQTQPRSKDEPDLRLSSCLQAAVGEALQTPRCECAATGPQSPQPDAFHWPDVQELRCKYAEPARPRVGRSRTVPNGALERSANGGSLKHSSACDLRPDPDPDASRTRGERALKGRRPSVEDWPQTRQQPLLCRWSSLDHMLGSLPLHEVQNLQEPKKTSAADGDARLEGLEATGKPAGTTSGKVSESKLVKSLRDKFQSLSSSS
ncbi:pleckstrin homology domain-containing family G member 3 isoform X2 [Betta splendens]|uniref:Pleckstrin homology domain-containing family G member 3 isoform X2 n=1 Tax=Betta splendens TaxID=158456 RepID=A0A6P7LHA7_BETSP|nr:pleckstrin homology domain-containing family G member 3 isoform X2 [Betta splendens]